jgi:pyruvate kinase
MTVSNGKPVITATQMLESMQRNPKPTRAEASDVANAILDGSSAIMLSGETAAGDYPIKAVQTMSDIALRAESYLSEYGYLQIISPNPAFMVTEAVSQAATTMASNLKTEAIFCLTESGFTPRMVSKHRPECPIFAITSSKRVARKLAMNWGVIPICYEGVKDDEAKLSYGIQSSKKQGLVRAGDLIIATAGFHQQAGGTDSIRVIRLDNHNNN